MSAADRIIMTFVKNIYEAADEAEYQNLSGPDALRKFARDLTVSNIKYKIGAA